MERYSKDERGILHLIPDKKVLLVVDVQRAFIIDSKIQKIADDIIRYIKESNYDLVISTKFRNTESSLFKTALKYDRCFDTDDLLLYKDLDRTSDIIVEKTGYSCVTTDFINELKEYCEDELPEEIDIIGFDTDSCILASAFSLWDLGIKPNILAPYTVSSGGDDITYYAYEIIKRNFGRIIYDRVNLED